MKRMISLLLCGAMAASLVACGLVEHPTMPDPAPPVRGWEGATHITMFDEGITVDDQPISTEETAAVYAAHDIVYYEEGHDFTYGEGTEADAHSAEEAAKHTVVTIREPGTYVLSGKLSAGQIAVDLGEDAEDDPNAVVTLVLDGVDITCTVAPAIIFYNVYECGDKDNPTKDVDTSAAGANVILSAGTDNHINGSYVARIYQPDTVELSEDGTEVVEAKKLHKYDGAFYSRMSMNISGEGDGINNGTLYINGENEGLDSEMHLTIHSGTIYINSGNDGINTNEDGVSVTTINGGNLYITVAGETGEGDGIDSNGWLVINEGARVIASACNNSADSGIDSDMGIHIAQGSLVIASGHMLDRIEGAEQNYVVFQCSGTRPGGEELTLKDANGAEVISMEPANGYSVLLVSTDALLPGDYTLWCGETQLGHSGARDGMMGPPGGRPGGMMPPEGFGPEQMPEGMEPPTWNGGERPERPEEVEPPEEFAPQNMPFIPAGPRPNGMMGRGQKATQAVFPIEGKENYFSGVGELQFEE